MVSGEGFSKYLDVFGIVEMWWDAKSLFLEFVQQPPLKLRLNILSFYAAL